MTTKKQLKHALLAVSVSLASFTPFAFADYTIFHNAKGYTLKQDKGVHEFSTLVIKDGKVVATGDKSIISTYFFTPSPFSFKGLLFTTLYSISTQKLKTFKLL